ncbi:GLUG motif-containing protein [Coprobacter secundus]|uniref:GLUG motif-containing protein n=1 Tax=Coprobacter secundus TaxID=1501392 RepID=UPI0022DF8D91|nr:GLUG motif-containing protein [Coprobacter secundus]
MRKRLFLMLFAWINIGIFTMNLNAFSGSGNGDEDSPYLITSATELNEIRNNPEAHYKLMNNIDLTDWITENSSIEGWEPINEFKGVLDGNGFVISGLWIERPETEKIGFFGSVAGAIIKRTGIVIPDNKKIVGKKYVGGLVGQTPYTTTEISIDECFVTGGTIESKDQAAGGILGYTSTNSVTVNIRNCYTANSTVISVDGAGGIVGTAYRNINIENCYSTNTIISANNDKASGGIAGGFNDAKDSYTIKNSIALNPSIASSKSAGRIIGWVKDGSKTKLSNNYAFDDMLVDGKILSGEATDNNGLDKSKEELNEISAYTSLGWNFDVKGGIWAMGNGKYSLPVLKNVSLEMQPTITPDHLYVEVNPDDGFSGSGNGDENSPYLITSATELNEIRNNLEAHYKLMNNIDLTDWITENSPIEGWVPINGFSGSLDGNGFIIYGVWIDRPAINNVGLFGSITGGVIKRTGIIIPDDKKIEGNNNVGGFVGHTPYTTAEISIDECFVTGGTIEAKGSAAGGILGYTSTNSTTVNIRNCYVANTTVLGADGAGGLVGTAYRSINVENCYSTGVVKSTNNDKSAGGLVGGTNDQGENYTIKNSIALNPEIFSSKSAGRIVGWIKNSAKTTLSNNYAFEEMLVDGKTLSGEITDNNGLNKSKEEVNDVSTYLSLGWNFDEDGIWIMGNGKYTLPILKNVLAKQQPAVMPKHLEMNETAGVLTEKENKLSIYPSVTEGEIFITNKALSSIVSVYDFSGRIVMQSDKSMLNLSSLANGIYLVKVENKIIKVVKK